MAELAPRRASSVKIRRACFDRNKWTDQLTGRIMLTCHICKLPIDPAREKWDAEHVIRRVLTRSDDPSGILPAHTSECHSEKTKNDNRENNKGQRIRDRHYGIKQSKGFYKPKGVEFDWSTGRYRKVGDE